MLPSRLQTIEKFAIMPKKTRCIVVQIMEPQEIILIGIKHSVSAVSKADGHALWTTKLPGGLGGDFVTVASDGERVFAHSSGQLFCLDLWSGRLLWTNELRGYGYGLASICVPGMAASPDMAAVRAIQAQREAANAGTAAT
jgi:outer membrane protein assembly factor BamB